MKLTAEQRGELARTVVADALAAMRAGDPAEANGLFAHLVHDGVPPVEVVGEIVAQTGGAL